MSFMFKPLKYDDPKAFNTIKLDRATKKSLCTDTEKTAKAMILQMKKNHCNAVALDGYISASYTNLNKALKKEAKKQSLTISFLDMKKLYKSQKEIDALTAKSLPLNYDEDPVLLFGRLYKGSMCDLIQDSAVKTITSYKKKTKLLIVYGVGSACRKLRNCYDAIGYVDVTPKECAIRAREGKYVNIGDEKARSFKMIMRRNYFVDFEVAVRLRKELLLKNKIDFYILGSNENCYQMLPKAAANKVMDTLIKYPFRAKPVYMEGIWGGEFIRKIRNIPMDIASNIAWIFEFIPMEVSIVVDIDGTKVDIPFSTFLAKEGKKMLGEHCYDEFDGYFPVRFNYDDTWHSNGNMSVQCHPTEDFIIGKYDEFGRQDEAYYVISTGHHARTYLGWKGDGKKFLKLCEKSEKDHKDIDYQKYVNSVESYPGRQVMIPSGTVHASGRDQFILELGSLTIGSYTYKVYDYNRIDSDGKPRPIHTKNAEKILHFERNSKWVDKNVAIKPIPYAKGKGYEEFVVGKTNLMYYETHRIEMDKGAKYVGKNKEAFTVLTVVDGEKVRISSKSHPEYNFTLDFLEIATVPNTITDYVIENLGYQPCVVHKTIMRPGYTRYQNQKYKNRERGE